MKIIFCDTSVVFGLFQRFVTGAEICNSVLMKLAKKYDVYISEYVLLELQENYVEDHGIIITPEQLSDFVNMIGMKAIQSGPIQPDISWMVGDVDDLQILQDAVVVSADVLITKNIQDFDVGSIYEYLHIQVVDSIPYELLIGL